NHCKLIIVPHEIDETYLRSLKNHFSRGIILYSEAATGKKFADEQVLIVDRFGLLSSIYQYGSVAYVGGGFGKGIHNILEAAVYGIPVLFGPRYQKFNEAIALTKRNGAKS